MSELNLDSKTRITRWLLDPLEALRNIPENDGALIAVAVACFLYERYATALNSSIPRSKKQESGEPYIRLAHDFQISEEGAEKFWKAIRHGFLHQGLPLQSNRDGALPRYEFSVELEKPLEFINGDPEVLKIHPWLFVDKVQRLCRNNIDLLSSNKSSPVPVIYSVSVGRYTTKSP